MKIIRPMSPLRQRMLEDLQIRNYSPHTVDAYLRSVAQFAKHFHTSPDRLGVTDCNRNRPGLQSPRFPDHILCIYHPCQDRIICH